MSADPAPTNRLSDAGCVSGRFQPLHNDHLDLITQVLDRHHLLIVAITNPDAAAREEHPSNPDRHRPQSNPFSFFERMEFVKAALIKVPRSRYEVVPFPLHNAEAVLSYVPREVTQYVRVLSDWERAKSRMLESYGYRVETIRGASIRQIRSTDIRRALAEGMPWSHLVPTGVAPLVEDALAARGRGSRTR